MKRVVLNYARPGIERGWQLTWVDWVWLSAFVVLPIMAFSWIVTPRISTGGNAQHAKTVADIDGFRTALDSFRNNNGRYPTTEEGLQALIENPSNLPKWQKSLDTDRIPLDPWGHSYIYRSPGKNGKPYDLLSAGPDGQEGTPDDISGE